MKLSYFDLLSPEPVQLQNTGGIVSPKLRDIAAVGYNTYQYYLGVLSMDPKAYLSMLDPAAIPGLLSDGELGQLNIFELLTANEHSRSLLQAVLNFFIKEDVLYSPGHNGFAVQDHDTAVGAVTKENYPFLCELIYQRNCIKYKHRGEPSEVKSKKALEIMKKLEKGRAEKSQHTKADKNMELGNIISSVANKSPSLNIVNIWDLTIFQLWDCFLRLSNNTIYDIQSMSVAAWGNKDNRFDAAAWFKAIETDN